MKYKATEEQYPGELQDTTLAEFHDYYLNTEERGAPSWAKAVVYFNVNKNFFYDLFVKLLPPVFENRNLNKILSVRNNGIHLRQKKKSKQIVKFPNNMQKLNLKCVIIYL